MRRAVAVRGARRRQRLPACAFGEPRRLSLRSAFRQTTMQAACRPPSRCPALQQKTVRHCCLFAAAPNQNHASRSALNPSVLKPRREPHAAARKMPVPFNHNRVAYAVQNGVSAHIVQPDPRTRGCEYGDE